MKKIYLWFVVICLCILVIPAIGLLFYETNTKTEDGEEIVIPTLINEDDTINSYYLKDMGDYFNDNFAYRQEMISMNAKLYATIFHVSTTDQVLLGKNDWMYYTNTLNDYTAMHSMSERGLENVVHNISLMQNYIEENGSAFIVTIAPNKNSLYDENMPYYYKSGEGNNYARLEKKLTENNIHYVNLFKAFQDTEEVLYLKQDSHWNNKGAALAYNQIMSQTDLDYETYEKVDYIMEKNHAGDLATMIYPIGYGLEENVSYLKDWKYSYYGEVTDNMDNFIATTSPKSNSVLLMYRDSFGESLLPFFADEFGVAYFSRLLPYNLKEVEIYHPDYVVMERVERRISGFAEQAAIMEMPVVEFDVTTDYKIVYEDDWHIVSDSDVMAGKECDCQIKENGAYYQIDGLVEETDMTDTSKIFLAVEESDGTTTIYDTFWISRQDGEYVNDYCFSLYLAKETIPENVSKIQVLVTVEELAYYKGKNLSAHNVYNSCR